jgi:hypothetical protein
MLGSFGTDRIRSDDECGKCLFKKMKLEMGESNRE